MACPVNRIGEVSLWQAGRHGALDGAGAPAFLASIKPQVIVVNNGPRKGLGGPSPGAQKAASVHYDRLAQGARRQGHLAGPPVAARPGSQHGGGDDRQPRGDGRVPRPLDQGVGIARRHVHADQRPQSVQQDLHRAVTGTATGEGRTALESRVGRSRMHS